MITHEENEMMCCVGKGTVMGDFMREFWTPACLSSELERDAPPMRLMLYGEKLIAFRDTKGRVGIMDHRCPHRCASLFFGRNEEGGIRCGYHGWKFDVEGNCLDQPNLPDKNKYPAGVKSYAYKVTEQAGIIFVYMGKRAVPPPMPTRMASPPTTARMRMWVSKVFVCKAITPDIIYRATACIRSDIGTSATDSRSEQNYFARGKRWLIYVSGTNRKKSDCSINVHGQA